MERPYPQLVDLLALDRAQKLRLRQRAHVADFVEKAIIDILGETFEEKVGRQLASRNRMVSEDPFRWRIFA